MKIIYGNSINSFENNDFFKEKVQNKEIKGFSDILKESIYSANSLKKEADSVTEDFLAGKSDNLHEVMIAAQKAEVAISFVTEVRNRLVEAYQEFSKMQL